MDVTTQTQMLHADLDRLAKTENGLSRYLAQTIRPWITYSVQTRNLPGCWIHDVLTIAWLLDPLLQQRLKIIWMYLWKALHAE